MQFTNTEPEQKVRQLVLSDEERTIHLNIGLIHVQTCCQGSQDRAHAGPVGIENLIAALVGASEQFRILIQQP